MITATNTDIQRTITVPITITTFDGTLRSHPVKFHLTISSDNCLEDFDKFTVHTLKFDDWLSRLFNGKVLVDDNAVFTEDLRKLTGDPYTMENVSLQHIVYYIFNQIQRGNSNDEITILKLDCEQL